MAERLKKKEKQRKRSSWVVGMEAGEVSKVRDPYLRHSGKKVAAMQGDNYS